MRGLAQRVQHEGVGMGSMTQHLRYMGWHIKGVW